MNATPRMIFAVAKLAPRSFSQARAFGFATSFLMITAAGVLTFVARLVSHQTFQWFGFVVTLVMLPMFAWAVSYVASAVLAWAGGDDDARADAHQPAA